MMYISHCCRIYRSRKRRLTKNLTANANTMAPTSHSHTLLRLLDTGDSSPFDCTAGGGVATSCVLITEGSSALSIASGLVSAMALARILDCCKSLSATSGVKSILLNRSSSLLSMMRPYLPIPLPRGKPTVSRSVRSMSFHSRFPRRKSASNIIFIFGLMSCPSFFHCSRRVSYSRVSTCFQLLSTPFQTVFDQQLEPY